MHSDPESVRKSVRKYLTVGAALLIFTAITVAANLLHFTVPVAIAVALFIAATKGSMVASVFMHLNYEQKWIYGALTLTVVFFIVLLFLPLLTELGSIASTGPYARAALAAAGHGGH